MFTSVNSSVNTVPAPPVITPASLSGDTARKYLSLLRKFRILELPYEVGQLLTSADSSPSVSASGPAIDASEHAGAKIELSGW